MTPVRLEHFFKKKSREGGRNKKKKKKINLNHYSYEFNSHEHNFGILSALNHIYHLTSRLGVK